MHCLFCLNKHEALMTVAQLFGHVFTLQLTFLYGGEYWTNVIVSCAVRHYIVLHGYVAGYAILYPICCLIVRVLKNAVEDNIFKIFVDKLNE